MKQPQSAPDYVHKPGDKIFSNKLFAGYIQFMDEKVGPVMTDQVLARLGLDRVALGDLNAYSSDEVSQAVTLAATEITGEKRLSYLVGRNIVKSIGKVAGFVAGVTSPAFFMKNAGGIEERLALNTINKTTQLGRNRFKIEITYRGGYRGHDYICDNRIGCFEAAPLFFGLPYAKVDHPQCQYRGEGNCIYYVTFPEYSFLAIKRVAIGLMLASAVAAVWYMSIMGAWLHAIPEALLLAAFGSYAWYKHLSARKSLEWSLLNNEGLVTQNMALDAVNTKLSLLQKLTAGIVESRDSDSALACVAQGLVREMRYGSSQVWLLDPDGKELRCVRAEGYPEEMRRFILEARFDYRDNSDNPYGLLAQTMRQGKTIIVNEIDEVMPRLSGQAQEFLKALKLSSFIMSPLIHEGRPLGVLAGEFHNGEKVDHQDQNIFQSLALILTSALRRESTEDSRDPIPGPEPIKIHPVPPDPAGEGTGQQVEAIARQFAGPIATLRSGLTSLQGGLAGLERFRTWAYREARTPEALSGLKRIESEAGLDAAKHSAAHDSAATAQALDRCEAILARLRAFAVSSQTGPIVEAPQRGTPIESLVRKAMEAIPPQSADGITVSIDRGLSAAGTEADLVPVFRELIVNAMEAMDGSGSLQVTGRMSEGKIRLAFRDQGPGVPAELEGRLFDPFFTTKPPGQGLGLGLALARNLLRRLDGDVYLEPVNGKGARFVVALPSPHG